MSIFSDGKTSRTALLFLRSFLSTAFLALFLFSRFSLCVCVCWGCTFWGAVCAQRTLFAPEAKIVWWGSRDGTVKFCIGALRPLSPVQSRVCPSCSTEAPAEAFEELRALLDMLPRVDLQRDPPFRSLDLSRNKSLRMDPLNKFPQSILDIRNLASLSLVRLRVPSTGMCSATPAGPSFPWLQSTATQYSGPKLAVTTRPQHRLTVWRGTAPAKVQDSCM